MNNSNVTATGRVFLRRHLEPASPRRRPWNRSSSHWYKRSHPKIQKSQLSDWKPPEYFNYFRVSGPKTIPKIGKNFKLKLTVSVASVLIGAFCTPEHDEEPFITLRIFSSKAVPTSPSFHNIFAQIIALPYPEMDMRCEDILITLRIGMFVNLTYRTDRGEGVIESFYDRYTPREQQYTVPNYHFTNCIKCKDHAFQIGYEVNSGPVLARLLYLQSHPSDTPTIFNYRLTKKAYAISGDQEVNLNHGPIILDLEVVKVCHYPDEPTYCMVIGKIIRAYLPSDNSLTSSTYQAEDPAESDQCLFTPGGYVHIDHWDNRGTVQKTSVTPLGVFDGSLERAYINYFIGPQTAHIGSFPFFPRLEGNQRKLQ